MNLLSEYRIIAGVDGCKAGWVAAIDDGAKNSHCEVYSSFEKLLDACRGLIVIDVPIGLPDNAPRAADGEARKLLRHRHSCVFPAPYRPMVTARSQSEASEIRETIDGKRCTIQAFSIFPKIAEVDKSMTPLLQERVSEGHPELSFTALLGGQPLNEGKQTPSGHWRRLEALRPHFPGLDALLAQQRSRGVGRDDVLDAFVMLWTARRVAAKTAVSVPRDEQFDARGLSMRIVA